jgi:predicted metal-binding membrane protein
MMTAMMLPSVAPLLLLQRRAGRSAALLAVGYLAVWSATGVPIFLVTMLVDPMMVPAAAAGAIVVAAGLYQLTPLKRVCLRKCRSPLDFLLQHWRRGRLGELRLGALHGAYCVGCCWALMAVLVFAAAMSLWWAAAIAGVVFIEKVLPWGDKLGRVLAVGLVTLGAVTAAA